MAFPHAGHYGPEAVIDDNGNVQAHQNVVVYQYGTTTPATLWTDEFRTSSGSNPFQTDVDGNAIFFADPNDYTVVFYVEGVPQPPKRITVYPNITDWVASGGMGSLSLSPPDDQTNAITINEPDVGYEHDAPTYYGHGQAMALMDYTYPTVPPGVTDRGSWSSTYSYALFDQVEYGGATYYSVVGSNLNHQPDVSTQWVVLPSLTQALVARGAWLSSTTYNQWDQVTYNGDQWIAVRASTNQTPGYLSSYWQPVAGPGSLRSRLDGFGGSGWSGPLHIATGLRWKEFAVNTGSTSIWIQPYYDASGVRIYNPPVYSVPTPSAPFLECWNIRSNPAVQLANIDKNGHLNLFGSNGSSTTAIFAAGDSGVAGYVGLLSPTITTTSALALKGASGQTAVLLDVRNSSLTPLLNISSSGNINLLNTAGTAGLVSLNTSDIGNAGYQSFFSAGGATITTMGIRGFSGQTSNLLNFLNSSNTPLSVVSASGNFVTFNTAGAASAATLASGDAGSLLGYRGQLSAISASTVPLGLFGAASQTANLVELKSSAGSLLTVFNSTGGLFLYASNGSTNAAFIAGQDAGSANFRAHFNAVAATTTPLALIGAASQTADLMDVFNSSLTKLVGITSGGVWTAFATDGTTPVVQIASGDAGLSNVQVALTMKAATTVPLSIKAAASQSALLLGFYNSSGTSLYGISPVGHAVSFATNGSTTASSVGAGDGGNGGIRGYFAAISITTIPIVAGAAASQTASIFEARNSAGTKLVGISGAGVLQTFASDGATSILTAVPGDSGSFGVHVSIIAKGAAVTPLLLKTAASPTSAPFIINDSSNNNLFSILANGQRKLASGNQTTGAGTPTFGANCPAVTLTPNTWEKVTLADGSQGYVPVWK